MWCSGAAQRRDVGNDDGGNGDSGGVAAAPQLSYSCSFFVVVVVRLGEEFSFPNKVDHIIETIFNIYY